MPTINNWRDLDAIARRAEPRVRAAMRRAIERLQRVVTVRQLAEGTIPLPTVTAHLEDLRAVLEAVSTEAARVAFGSAVRQTSFTLVNPDAVIAASSRRTSAVLVKAVGRDIKQAIRVLITASIRDGVPMAETARRMRDVIGLGPWQVRSLDRQRAELVRRGYAGDRLERKMAALSKRAHILRTETIARTETIRAANIGQDAIWQRMQERRNAGPGRQATYVRKWIVTPDSRLCKVCEPMARNGGQRRPLGEDFVSPYNGARAPHPPMHPRCRCAVGLVAPRLR